MDTLVSVWLPLGILATAIGVFCLGAALGGIATGALAVALLAAVPDPASYGIKQGFYSFHWLMEVTPGSLYALPVGALSLALLCRWSRRMEAGALVGSLVFLASMFLLRFHLLLWLAVPWGVAACLVVPWLPKRLKIGLIAAGTIALPLLMVAYARQEIEQVSLMGFLTNGLVAIHRDMVPNNAHSLVPWMIAHLPGFALVPALVTLSFAAIGGLPLVLFLVLVVLHRRSLEPIDAVPLALLVWAAMLMLLAPSPAPSYGDPSEFRHRGMVLIHALLCCWNSRLLLLGWARHRQPFALALLPLAVLPISLVSVAAWKAPRADWTVTFRQTPIDPALISVAGWLRGHAQPGDTFAMTKLKSRAPNVDDPTILTALSGVPAFIARPGVQGGATSRARKYRAGSLGAAWIKSSWYRRRRRLTSLRARRGSPFWSCEGTDRRGTQARIPLPCGPAPWHFGARCREGTTSTRSLVSDPASLVYAARPYAGDHDRSPVGRRGRTRTGACPVRTRRRLLGTHPA